MQTTFEDRKLLINVVAITYFLHVLAIWNGVERKIQKHKISCSFRNSRELTVQRIVTSNRELYFQNKLIIKCRERCLFLWFWLERSTFWLSNRSVELFQSSLFQAWLTHFAFCFEPVYDNYAAFVSSTYWDSTPQYVTYRIFDCLWNYIRNFILLVMTKIGTVPIEFTSHQCATVNVQRFFTVCFPKSGFERSNDEESEWISNFTSPSLPIISLSKIFYGWPRSLPSRSWCKMFNVSQKLCIMVMSEYRSNRKQTRVF